MPFRGIRFHSVGSVSRRQAVSHFVIREHSSRSSPVALRGKHQTTLAQRITSAGLHLLDGTGMEWGGIGFAGTKRFIGGFGRGALTAFGEPEIKTFVKVSIDESLKLETALSQLRTPKRVVVLGPPFIEKMEARSTNAARYLCASIP